MTASGGRLPPSIHPSSSSSSRSRPWMYQQRASVEHDYDYQYDTDVQQEVEINAPFAFNEGREVLAAAEYNCSHDSSLRSSGSNQNDRSTRSRPVAMLNCTSGSSAGSSGSSASASYTVEQDSACTGADGRQGRESVDWLLARKWRSRRVQETVFHTWLLSVVGTYEQMCHLAASHRQNGLRKALGTWKAAYASRTAEILAEAQFCLTLQARAVRAWSAALVFVRDQRIKVLSLRYTGHSRLLGEVFGIWKEKNSGSCRGDQHEERLDDVDESASANNETDKKAVVTPTRVAPKIRNQPLRGPGGADQHTGDVVDHSLPLHTSIPLSEISPFLRSISLFDLSSSGTSQQKSLLATQSEAAQHDQHEEQHDVDTQMMPGFISKSGKTPFAFTSGSSRKATEGGPRSAKQDSKTELRTFLESTFQASLQRVRQENHNPASGKIDLTSPSFPHSQMKTDTDNCSTSRSTTKLLSLIASAESMFHVRDSCITASSDGRPMLNLAALQKLVQKSREEQGDVAEVETRSSRGSSKEDRCRNSSSNAKAAGTESARTNGHQHHHAESMTFSLTNAGNLASEIHKWRGQLYAQPDDMILQENNGQLKNFQAERILEEGPLEGGDVEMHVSDERSQMTGLPAPAQLNRSSAPSSSTSSSSILRRAVDVPVRQSPGGQLSASSCTTVRASTSSSSVKNENSSTLFGNKIQSVLNDTRRSIKTLRQTLVDRSTPDDVSYDICELGSEQNNSAFAAAAASSGFQNVSQLASEMKNPLELSNRWSVPPLVACGPGPVEVVQQASSSNSGPAHSISRARASQSEEQGRGEQPVRAVIADHSPPAAIWEVDEESPVSTQHQDQENVLHRQIAQKRENFVRKVLRTWHGKRAKAELRVEATTHRNFPGVRTSAREERALQKLESLLQNKSAQMENTSRAAAGKNLMKKAEGRVLKSVFQRWTRHTHRKRTDRWTQVWRAIVLPKVRRVFEAWRDNTNEEIETREIVSAFRSQIDARLRHAALFAWEEVASKRRRNRERGDWWQRRRTRGLQRALIGLWHEHLQHREWCREVLRSTALARTERVFQGWALRTKRDCFVRRSLEIQIQKRRQKSLQRIFSSWIRRVDVRHLIQNRREKLGAKLLTRSFNVWARGTRVSISVSVSVRRQESKLLRCALWLWRQKVRVWRSIDTGFEASQRAFYVRVFRGWRHYVAASWRRKRKAFEILCLDAAAESSRTQNLGWRLEKTLSTKRRAEQAVFFRTWKIFWFRRQHGVAVSNDAEEQIEYNKAPSSGANRSRGVSSSSSSSRIGSGAAGLPHSSSRRGPAASYRATVLTRTFSEWASPLLQKRQAGARLLLAKHFARWKNRDSVRFRCLLAFRICLRDAKHAKWLTACALLHWRKVSAAASSRENKTTTAANGATALPREEHGVSFSLATADHFLAADCDEDVLAESAYLAGASLASQVLFEPYQSRNFLGSQSMFISPRRAGARSRAGPLRTTNNRYGTGQTGSSCVNEAAEETCNTNVIDAAMSTTTQSQRTAAKKPGPMSEMDKRQQTDVEENDRDQHTSQAEAHLRNKDKRNTCRRVFFSAWSTFVCTRKENLANFLQKRQQAKRQERRDKLEQKSRVVAFFKARRRKIKQFLFKEIWWMEFVMQYKLKLQKAATFRQTVLEKRILKQYLVSIWKQLFIDHWRALQDRAEKLQESREQKLGRAAFEGLKLYREDKTSFRERTEKAVGNLTSWRKKRFFVSFKSGVEEQKSCVDKTHKAHRHRHATLIREAMLSFRRTVELARRKGQADEKFLVYEQTLMKRAFSHGFVQRLQSKRKCVVTAELIREKRRIAVLQEVIQCHWLVHYRFRRKVRSATLRRLGYWFSKFHAQVLYSLSAQRFRNRKNHLTLQKSFLGFALFRLQSRSTKRYFLREWRCVVELQRHRARIALEFARAVAHAENLRRRTQKRWLRTCVQAWSQDSFQLWAARRLVKVASRFAFRQGFQSIYTRPIDVAAGRMLLVYEKNYKKASFDLFRDSGRVNLIRGKHLEQSLRSVLGSWRECVQNQRTGATKFLRTLERAVPAVALRRIRSFSKFLQDAELCAATANQVRLAHPAFARWVYETKLATVAKPLFQHWKRFQNYRLRKRQVSLLLFFRRARERQTARLRSDMAYVLYQRRCARKCLLVWGACRQRVLDVRQSSDVWDMQGASRWNNTFGRRRNRSTSTASSDASSAFRRQANGNAAKRNDCNARVVVSRASGAPPTPSASHPDETEVRAGAPRNNEDKNDSTNSQSSTSTSPVAMKSRRKKDGKNVYAAHDANSNTNRKSNTDLDGALRSSYFHLLLERSLDFGQQKSTSSRNRASTDLVYSTSRSSGGPISRDEAIGLNTGEGVERMKEQEEMVSLSDDPEDGQDNCTIYNEENNEEEDVENVDGADHIREQDFTPACMSTLDEAEVDLDAHDEHDSFLSSMNDWQYSYQNVVGGAKDMGEEENYPQLDRYSRNRASRTSLRSSSSSTSNTAAEPVDEKNMQNDQADEELHEAEAADPKVVTTIPVLDEDSKKMSGIENDQVEVQDLIRLSSDSLELSLTSFCDSKERQSFLEQSEQAGAQDGVDEQEHESASCTRTTSTATVHQEHESTSCTRTTSTATLIQTQLPDDHSCRSSTTPVQHIAVSASQPVPHPPPQALVSASPPSSSLSLVAPPTSSSRGRAAAAPDQMQILRTSMQSGQFLKQQNAAPVEGPPEREVSLATNQQPEDEEALNMRLSRSGVYVSLEDGCNDLEMELEPVGDADCLRSSICTSTSLIENLPSSSSPDELAAGSASAPPASDTADAPPASVTKLTAAAARSTTTTTTTNSIHSDTASSTTTTSSATCSLSPRMAQSTRRKRNKYYDFARKRKYYHTSSCDSIREASDEDQEDEDEQGSEAATTSRRASPASSRGSPMEYESPSPLSTDRDHFAAARKPPPHPGGGGQHLLRKSRGSFNQPRQETPRPQVLDHSTSSTLSGGKNKHVQHSESTSRDSLRCVLEAERKKSYLGLMSSSAENKDLLPKTTSAPPPTTSRTVVAANGTIEDSCSTSFQQPQPLVVVRSVPTAKLLTTSLSFEKGGLLSASRATTSANNTTRGTTMSTSTSSLHQDQDAVASGVVVPASKKVLEVVQNLDNDVDSENDRDSVLMDCEA
ncbi:unnamed protein product [Amoebophrya sp. A120]|nr:unnamed protein product [Amoebophrya sp. A120]|eukprot:GSA120T00012626001.1